MSLLAALAFVAAQPADPGSYRAIGAGPLWQVGVGNGFMAFETPGQPAVNLEAPPRRENANGFAWRSPELTINVTHGGCTDALTHRAYADRVSVETRGRRYEGCGGAAVGWTRHVPYGAAGGEPFWSLEISDGRLYFGVNDEVFIVPEPRMTRTGRTRRYHAPGITVLLRRENCQLEDERTWSDDVTVIAGSWRVLGCGGRVVREAPGE